MKKIIVLITMATMALSVSAATINWNIAGLDRVLLERDGATIAAGTAVYLVLASDLAAITSASQTEAEFFSNLAGITINTTAAQVNGKKPTVVSGIVSTSALIDSGTTYSFAMLYVSQDVLGNGYFKVSPSVSGTAYVYNPSDTSNSQVTAPSWSNMHSAGWTQGFAPVPEPATAALAIAGLAMLIRRRK